MVPKLQVAVLVVNGFHTELAGLDGSNRDSEKNVDFSLHLHYVLCAVCHSVSQAYLLCSSTAYCLLLAAC